MVAAPAAKVTFSELKGGGSSARSAAGSKFSSRRLGLLLFRAQFFFVVFCFNPKTVQKGCAVLCFIFILFLFLSCQKKVLLRDGLAIRRSTCCLFLRRV